MKNVKVSKFINQDTDTIFELISAAGIPSRSNYTVVKHVPVMDPSQVGKDFYLVTPSQVEKRLLDWKQSMVLEEEGERPLEVGKVDTKYELVSKGNSTLVKFTISYEVKSSLLGALSNAVVLPKLMKKIAKKNLEELNIVLNKGKTALAA